MCKPLRLQRWQHSASSSYGLRVGALGKEEDCPAIPHNRSRTLAFPVHGIWPRIAVVLCPKEAIDHSGGPTESALALARESTKRK